LCIPDLATRFPHPKAPSNATIRFRAFCILAHLAAVKRSFVQHPLRTGLQGTRIESRIGFSRLIILSKLDGAVSPMSDKRVFPLCTQTMYAAPA
jgi:hypothetical protein